MASNTSLCAICDLRHLTASSTHWCPECEEALCVDCKEHHILSKASRGHHITPISDYNDLPPFIANIELFCTYHNEKYLQYCVKHEVPICYKCIKEHGNCGGLTLLEDLASEVKSSEVFRDMEQSLHDIIVNISRIRENRESNIITIKDKKKQIIEDVLRLKKEINLHLDKMQEDFMKELDKVEAECYEKIESIVSSLKDQDKEIVQCNADIENIKTYASDLQAFLGMRDIQNTITKNKNYIEFMVQSKNVETIVLDCSIDAKIQDSITNIKKLGSIMVERYSSETIELVRKKDRQAQILVTEENQSVNNIQLNFKRKLKPSCVNTRGCCMTEYGGYLFTDYHNHQEKLVGLNSSGKTEYTIKLAESYSAFDLACIDDNTVAVSTGYSYGTTGIMIIDLTTRKVKRFVELPGIPFGITFDGGSLICCCEGYDMREISCTDFSCTILPNTFTSTSSYVATQGEMIVYTFPYKNKVSCLNMRKLVWEFKNDALKNPGGKQLLNHKL
ncbi:uncharacterized protein LOC134684847 [Mytilus trossulus]|uniref:uncharacterized protein LOC134684847 n=1 Tax=Mytilus trossulus TaxID=6551 RepID=UPI0030053342